MLFPLWRNLTRKSLSLRSSSRNSSLGRGLRLGRLDCRNARSNRTRTLCPMGKGYKGGRNNSPPVLTAHYHHRPTCSLCQHAAEPCCRFGAGGDVRVAPSCFGQSRQDPLQACSRDTASTEWIQQLQQCSETLCGDTDKQLLRRAVEAVDGQLVVVVLPCKYFDANTSFYYQLRQCLDEMDEQTFSSYSSVGVCHSL